jgi:hypothetical protein
LEEDEEEEIGKCWDLKDGRKKRKFDRLYLEIKELMNN